MDDYDYMPAAACAVITSATTLLCRWEVIEAATGAPVLYGATLPANMTGPQVKILHSPALKNWSLLSVVLGQQEPYACLCTAGL